MKVETKLNISYKNGTKTCIHCLEARDAYKAAYYMIRRWVFIESVEVETGMVKLKMYVREYAGGRFLIFSRGDASIVSVRILNSNPAQNTLIKEEPDYDY